MASMRRHLTSWSAHVLIVAIAVVAWSECAGLQARVSARACCAAKHRCAGSAQADTCCKRMGGISSRSTLATGTTRAPVLAVHLLAVQLPFSESMASSHVVAVAAFTRPHDPPHLHTFSLRI
jgi:hypothetical protein